MDNSHNHNGAHPGSMTTETRRDDYGPGQPPRRISVAVAHRHKLYLQGLVRLLEDIREVEVVGQADTEQQLLDCVQRTPPEVAICEPFVSGFEGLDILERMQALCPGARVLLILHSADLALLSAAFRRGLWGYLSVNTTSEEFAKSIQAINKGELWVERRMMHRLLLEGTRLAADTANAMATLGQETARTFVLSPREQEIAGYVAAGLCNKRIAGKLSITESTVKAHLVKIFRKFDIHHRTQLAGYVCDAARMAKVGAVDHHDASLKYI